ncbi:unnamed protein product [Knipowitschia caucasica]
MSDRFVVVPVESGSVGVDPGSLDHDTGGELAESGEDSVFEAPQHQQHLQQAGLEEDGIVPILEYNREPNKYGA